MTHFPIPTNITSTLGIFTYVDTVSHGILGIMILFTIFIMTFIATKQYPTKEGFMFSAIITTVCCVFLWILGWVPDAILTLLIIISGISVIFLMRD